MTGIACPDAGGRRPGPAVSPRPWPPPPSDGGGGQGRGLTAGPGRRPPASGHAMPVITISRQFAAAGQAVGRRLAERFGAELLDREIVATVAERAGIPEAEAEGYDERLPG